ncbi:predicted protein [Chaetomium globosum CBS 148.51]|uniref:Uncharacterized protein n=1 Tax=Chaetomium globosum (strain ATCC 6205 / CBS 148.51 / DSM 1962 / NBRC 6347 / NRRL 1970) TaxID=306901 RepID=Q2GNJ9_CHAGB|nr:uncharacterized protein CHGG_10455 [Chaetomium globosum CBS 148.51]EAQ84051.1 predicted protein [Chaetomium globosum CBS 148.51]
MKPTPLILLLTLATTTTTAIPAPDQPAAALQQRNTDTPPSDDTTTTTTTTTTTPFFFSVDDNANDSGLAARAKSQKWNASGGCKTNWGGRCLNTCKKEAKKKGYSCKKVVDHIWKSDFNNTHPTSGRPGQDIAKADRYHSGETPASRHPRPYQGKSGAAPPARDPCHRWPDTTPSPAPVHAASGFRFPPCHLLAYPSHPLDIAPPHLLAYSRPGLCERQVRDAGID